MILFWVFYSKEVIIDSFFLTQFAFGSRLNRFCQTNAVSARVRRRYRRILTREYADGYRPSEPKSTILFLSKTLLRTGVEAIYRCSTLTFSETTSAISPLDFVKIIGPQKAALVQHVAFRRNPTNPDYSADLLHDLANRKKFSAIKKIPLTRTQFWRVNANDKHASVRQAFPNLRSIEFVWREAPLRTPGDPAEYSLVDSLGFSSPLVERHEDAMIKDDDTQIWDSTYVDGKWLASICPPTVETVLFRYIDSTGYETLRFRIWRDGGRFERKENLPVENAPRVVEFW